MSEVWKPIKGYEDFYEISNQGRIRTKQFRHHVRAGYVLKLKQHPMGYLAVNLRGVGTDKTYLVHRLVAETFLGNLESLAEVNHLNGNKKDNRAENLEIVSRQENIDHAVRHGLINNKGERNSQAKLTDDERERIRVAYTPGGYRAGGRGYKSLAKEFGVTWEAIRQIIKGRRK